MVSNYKFVTFSLIFLVRCGTIQLLTYVEIDMECY